MLAAIVPARGNSKRVKRKNLKEFFGKPLIYWSIKAALSSPSIQGNVWVTTEDSEIAEVAREFGASIVDRPKNLSLDKTETAEVIIHAISEVKKDIPKLDTIITFQPTNPLRPTSLIEDAIKLFRSNDCDSLLSISEKKLKIGDLNGNLFKPRYKFGKQSRLLSPTFYENGLLYITSLQTLEKKKSLAGEKIFAYKTPFPFDEVDLDTAEDFIYGESLLDHIKDELNFNYD